MLKLEWFAMMRYFMKFEYLGNYLAFIQSWFFTILFAGCYEN